MVVFYTPPVGKRIRHRSTVTIASLDMFGQGVAHIDNRVVFVPQTLPGETVDIELIEDKKQYAKGKLLKLHHPHAQRQIPACPHYGQCGGCQLQHMDRELQQQSKLTGLQQLWQKSYPQYPLPLAAAEIISGQGYHYRRRARLSVHFVRGQLKIGFRRQESNDIVDIQQCPVLVRSLEQLLVPLRQCLTALQEPALLGHIELLSLTSGQILIVRTLKPLSGPDYQKIADFARQYQLALFLHDKTLKRVEIDSHGHSQQFPVSDKVLTSPNDLRNDWPYYRLADLNLRLHPLGFIQVNEEINQKMVEKALDWLAPTVNDHVLDLFCGMGNFSLPIATKVTQLVGVEVSDDALKMARLNVALHHDKLRAACTFVVHNLDQVAPPPDWFNEPYNKVLLDPARTGAANMMPLLAKKQPERIVYISCNPATLVRDCQALLAAGYQVSKMAILDMFPQTKHVESMLLLSKVG